MLWVTFLSFSPQYMAFLCIVIATTPDVHAQAKQKTQFCLLHKCHIYHLFLIGTYYIICYVFLLFHYKRYTLVAWLILTILVLLYRDPTIILCTMYPMKSVTMVINTMYPMKSVTMVINIQSIHNGTFLPSNLSTGC